MMPLNMKTMLLPLQGEGITLGIIPQGDALGYVQTLPFQGANRPPNYSMFWAVYKPYLFKA